MRAPHGAARNIRLAARFPRVAQQLPSQPRVFQRRAAVRALAEVFVQFGVIRSLEVIFQPRFEPSTLHQSPYLSKHVCRSLLVSVQAGERVACPTASGKFPPAGLEREIAAPSPCSRSVPELHRSLPPKIPRLLSSPASTGLFRPAPPPAVRPTGVARLCFPRLLAGGGRRSCAPAPNPVSVPALRSYPLRKPAAALSSFSGNPSIRSLQSCTTRCRMPT